MNHHSKLRKKVLQGVYEDNAGIPRTDLGKRHPRGEAATVDSQPLAGFRGKLLLTVLLGLVTFLGINFRLVTIDPAGPDARQMTDAGSRHDVPDPIPTVINTLAGEQGSELPAASEPAHVYEDSVITLGRYDNMLAQLGMSMADLFDLEVRTIVIDPGHGGFDPGATGHQGLMEKDVALDIARRLRDKLASTGGYRVLLTREQDRKVYLKERVAFAKDNRADLFISIHINSLPGKASSLNYVETYYFGPTTDQRALELAEKENRESDYAMGDFREVIARIGDTLKTEESVELAGTLQSKLYQGLKKRNRGLADAGTKTGPFVVLLGVEVPSVLVEVSCISNKAEETRLSKAGYRDEIAGYLKSGIVEYLDRRRTRRSIDGGQFTYVAKQKR